MPAMEITAQGAKYPLNAPYEAGHVLNEAEASVINQTFAENVRNNFAQKMKKEPLSKASPTERIAAFTEYAKTYVFGVRVVGTGVSRERLDPVVKLAREMAREKLREALKKQNREVTHEQLEALVKDAVEKRPVFIQKAKELVAQRQAAAESMDLTSLIAA